jgi:hypothetical protein
MSIETILGLILLVAILGLFEMERLRKEVSRIRLAMDKEERMRLATYSQVDATGRLLASEIMDERERRLRRTVE